MGVSIYVYRIRLPLLAPRVRQTMAGAGADEDYDAAEAAEMAADAEMVEARRRTGGQPVPTLLTLV